MTVRPECEMTSTSDGLALVARELPWRRSVVLVVDLVESVRLMATDELRLIEQWRGFVRFATSRVLPTHRGRLVKSLGDGVMVQFDAAQDAVLAAFELHRHFEVHNVSCVPELRLMLRAGIHATHVYVDELDIYGSGVNLAARLASLAAPGETIVSAEVRDRLSDQIDVDVSDLGECHLKHVDRTVRAYRVSPPGAMPPVPLPNDRTSFAACVAVIPFQSLAGDDSGLLGDALADEVIASLSHLAELCVISRLSTANLKRSNDPIQTAARVLRANYVVHGTYNVAAGEVVIRAHLTATRSAEVLWAETVRAQVRQVFEGSDPVLSQLTSAVTRSILRLEVERVRSLPLPALEAYTLYLASVTLLHRLVREDFARGKELLEHLVARHPRCAGPKAMLAKWHLLLRLQGWSQDPHRSLEDAHAWARRAVDDQTDHAFALSMSGLIKAHKGGDLAAASDLCQQAIHADPQEPNAWLALGGIQGYRGEAGTAEASSQRAIALSPVDPARFLYDVFVAASKLVAHKYGEAAEAARHSIQLNAMHPASHRLLTIALALEGRLQEAKLAGQALLRLEPNFTVSGYMRQYAGRDTPHGREREMALRDAGLPR